MERAAASTSSTEPRAAAPPARLLAGWVAGAHGLRGRLRIRCDEGGAEGLLGVGHLFLGAREEEARRHEVVEARPGRRGEVCVDLGGIADRAAAEALRGAGVWIESAQLAVLPAGEYWAFQLIGCEVEDGAGRKHRSRARDPGHRRAGPPGGGRRGRGGAPDPGRAGVVARGRSRATADRGGAAAGAARSGLTPDGDGTDWGEARAAHRRDLDLSAPLRGLALGVAGGRGPRARARRSARPRPARAHARPPSQRRRRPLWGRPRHGDAPRAAGAGGRGRRRPQARRPRGARGPALAPGPAARPGAARRARGAAASGARLRSLRGRRPARRRARDGRRDLDRRLRAVGRRGAGDGGRRGRRAPDPRGRSATRSRCARSRSRRAFSKDPSTLGRPNSAAWRCPRCCAPEITERWRAGASKRRAR